MKAIWFCLDCREGQFDAKAEACREGHARWETYAVRWAREHPEEAVKG